MTIEEAFGAVLRRLRRENSLSQESLAHNSGLDRSFISQIEGGKQQPSLVTIFSIAKAVNIFPSVILKEVELLLRYLHPDMFKTELNRWEFNWVNKIEHITEKNSDCFKGCETILVADDEVHICNILSSFLRGYGYTVITAQDGDEAVKKYSQHINDIKLIIMDVVMPNKNGDKVYSEIKILKPEMNIIFTSGYSENSLGLMSDNKLIYKPFSPLEMLKIVRATLDCEL